MEKRDGNIVLRISKGDRERIRIKMKEAGIENMSAYIRKMALDGYCVRLELEELKEVLRLLRICSNNLNQYAKRANETRSIYQADIQDLQERLLKIWDLIREMLSRLSSIS